MNRAPSSLAQQRSSSKAHASKARGAAPTGDGDVSDYDSDLDLEHQFEGELSSSPSVRSKLALRPVSVAGKRMSMLPLPTSKGKASPIAGRESALGNRLGWK